jgi:hypothetical protein
MPEQAIKLKDKFANLPLFLYFNIYFKKLIIKKLKFFKR